MIRIDSDISATIKCRISDLSTPLPVTTGGSFKLDSTNSASQPDFSISNLSTAILSDQLRAFIQVQEEESKKREQAQKQDEQRILEEIEKTSRQRTLQPLRSLSRRNSDPSRPRRTTPELSELHLFVAAMNERKKYIHERNNKVMLAETKLIESPKQESPFENHESSHFDDDRNSTKTDTPPKRDRFPIGSLSLSYSPDTNKMDDHASMMNKVQQLLEKNEKPSESSLRQEDVPSNPNTIHSNEVQPDLEHDSPSLASSLPDSVQDSISEKDHLEEEIWDNALANSDHDHTPIVPRTAQQSESPMMQTDHDFLQSPLSSDSPARSGELGDTPEPTTQMSRRNFFDVSMQSLEDSEEFQSPDGTSFMSNHPWSKTNTSPLASPLHTPSYTVDPASTAHLSKSEYGGLGMSVFEGTAASEDVLKADSFFLTPNTTRHERYALDETGDSFPANMTLNDVLRLEQQLIQSPEPTQTHPNPAASPTGATQATSSLIEQSVASDHSQNPLPARAGTTIPTLPSKTLSEGEPDDYDNGRKSRVLNTTAKKSKSIPSRPKTAIGEIRSQRAVPKREEKMTNPKERKKVGEEKKFVSRVAVKKGQQQDPKAPSKENQKVQPKETPKTQQKTVVFVEEKSNAVERGEEAEEKGVSSKHASQRHLDLVKQQTPNDSPSESLNSTLDSLLRGVEEERSEEELPPLLGNNEAHKDGNDDPLDQGSIETVQTEPASESESESESESDSDGITQQPPPAASSHPSPHPSPQLSAPPTIAVASRPSKIPTLSPRPRKSESSHPIAFPDVEKARQKQEKDSSGPQKSHSNPTSSIKPSPKHSQTISDISSLKTGPKPKARQTTSLQNTKSKAKQAASPTTSSKSVEPVPKPEQKLTKPLRRPSASGPAHSDRPTTAKSARAEGPNTARTQRSESQTESLKNRASVTSLPGLRTSLDLSRQSISSISKSKSPLLTDRSRNSINGDMAGSEEDNAPKVFFSLSPLKMQKAERDKRIEQRASMDKESVKGETPAEAPVKVAPKPKPKKEIRKMSEINARDYLRQMRKKKSEN